MALSDTEAVNKPLNYLDGLPKELIERLMCFYYPLADFLPDISARMSDIYKSERFPETLLIDTLGSNHQIPSGFRFFRSPHPCKYYFSIAKELEPLRQLLKSEIKIESHTAYRWLCRCARLRVEKPILNIFTKLFHKGDEDLINEPLSFSKNQISQLLSLFVKHDLNNVVSIFLQHLKEHNITKTMLNEILSTKVISLATECYHNNNLELLQLLIQEYPITYPMIQSEMFGSIFFSNNLTSDIAKQLSNSLGEKQLGDINQGTSTRTMLRRVLKLFLTGMVLISSAATTYFCVSDDDLKATILSIIIPALFFSTILLMIGYAASHVLLSDRAIANNSPKAMLEPNLPSNDIELGENSPLLKHYR